MVERFIAPVLKTGDPQGSVGSNPTPSAIPIPSGGSQTSYRSDFNLIPNFGVVRVGRARPRFRRPHLEKSPIFPATILFRWVNSEKSGISPHIERLDYS